MDWLLFTIAICSLAWIAGMVNGKARISLLVLAILVFGIYAYSLFA